MRSKTSWDATGAWHVQATLPDSENPESGAIADPTTRSTMLKAIQIGLNTSDLAGSLRLYSEAFGFRNSGAQAVWEKTIGIQGLSPESRAIMWWMIGADRFFQLELFHHTSPVQRALPDDWKPSDHGGERFGV